MILSNWDGHRHNLPVLVAALSLVEEAAVEVDEMVVAGCGAVAGV